MKSAIIALALLFGLSAGGAMLIASGNAHAQEYTVNSGGGAG